MTINIVMLAQGMSFIECFHSRGQHLCKFIGTKESVCIRKEFNSKRIGVGHQHGCRFIVLGHQYGHPDIMWNHSIKVLIKISTKLCMWAVFGFTRDKYMCRLLKREFSSFFEIIWAFNQTVEWWWLSSSSTLQDIWYWSVLFLWITRSFAKNVVMSVKERYIVVVEVLYSIKRHEILIQCFMDKILWCNNISSKKKSPRQDFLFLVDILKVIDFFIPDTWGHYIFM